jgi:hypothetical protein
MLVEMMNEQTQRKKFANKRKQKHKANKICSVLTKHANE